MHHLSSVVCTVIFAILIATHIIIDVDAIIIDYRITLVMCMHKFLFRVRGGRHVIDFNAQSVYLVFTTFLCCTTCLSMLINCSIIRLNIMNAINISTK